MKPSPQRALVVVDAQNEYFTGSLRIAHPSPDQSLQNVLRAMDAAARHRVPIVVVQNSAPAGSPIFAKDSPGWQLVPAIAGRGRQHYVEKTLPSAFAGTDLAGWIERTGVQTLTLVGYMTHNCIAATAMDALHRGLGVEVLADATGAVPYTNAAGSASARQIHDTFCVVLHSRFAAVLSTERWIRHLERGEAAARGSIVASNRAALALAEAAQ